MGKKEGCCKKQTTSFLFAKRRFYRALLLCALTLIVASSCQEVTDLLEDHEFRQDLYDSYTSSYEFYSEDPAVNPSAEPVSIAYRIGSVQNFSDGELNDIIDQVSDGTHPFIGWEYLYNPLSGANVTPSNFSFNESNYINGAVISPQPAALLAVSGVNYTVEHHKQDPDLSGYTLSDTDVLFGAVGRTSRASEKTYTGFETVPTWSQTTVNADGSTVITIQYNRKVFTLTMDGNGGDDAGVTETTTGMHYRSPEPIPPNQFAREGYSFDGWAKTATGGKVYEDGDAYEIGNGNETIYAVWKANSILVSVEIESYGADNELEVEVSTGSHSVQIKWKTRDNYSQEVDSSVPASEYSVADADGFTTLTLSTDNLLTGTYDVYIEAYDDGQMPYSRDLKVYVP